MALLRSSLADKNIVDRTKAPRNREVAHAVRRTRDRLSQTQGNPVFDRELLKLHARAIINSAADIRVATPTDIAGQCSGISATARHA